MTTLQIARYEVHAHPLRFLVGAAIAVMGTALFLVQMAQFLAGVI